MRKEHRPGDNTQEAIRGVLIELPEDCINRGLINSLKSQMKSKLFIYFACLIFFAPLSIVTTQLAERSGQRLVSAWSQKAYASHFLSLSLSHSLTHSGLTEHGAVISANPD